MTDGVFIARVAPTGRDAAYDFHTSSLGDFVLPMARNQFFELVDAGQLLSLHRDAELVGLCYFAPDGKGLDEIARWELGGLHLAPIARGFGLATVLLKVAVAEALCAEPRPVMGYVHQENEAVRSVLLRLGFAPTGRTLRLGPDEARGFLRRDAAGLTTADVLTIPPAALYLLADWVETVDDKTFDSRVEVALSDDLWRDGRADVAAAVRLAADAQPIG
uniref:GNAT family N-acetyltransferase n=1 Tax=Paractinoplanes polyasparticus TaxID=2856853 RepID=UPI001C852FA1|nr:GNAT family N-acetyltransferase [Actinoplanes polyasparticus]